MAARPTNDEARALTTQLWATLAPPPVTREEMEKAIRKLWRFALRETFDGKIEFGRRNASGGYLIRVWKRRGYDYRTALPELMIGMEEANRTDLWEQLVAGCAYWMARYAKNEENTSYLGYMMVREVIKRGWLDGRLGAKLIPPKSREERAAEKRRKTVGSIKARIKAWTTKHKRATTALKKLNAQLKRMEKNL